MSKVKRNDNDKHWQCRGTRESLSELQVNIAVENVNALAVLESSSFPVKLSKQLLQVAWIL